MIKTILFDMDGTLIDCNADIFIPVYRDALIERFSSNPHCAEIVGTILKSPVAMVANDGSRTNQEAFVEFASKRLGEIMNVGDLEAQVNDFYEKEYIAVKKVIKQKEYIIKSIGVLKEKGYRLIVTTNPLFPLSALKYRLIWGGHNADLFDFITSFETSHYAKPNPLYYEEVLKRFNLNPSETLIVGNDLKEDIEAGLSLGLQTYFMKDTPIYDSDAEPNFQGTEVDFLEFAKKL